MLINRSINSRDHYYIIARYQKLHSAREYHRIRRSFFNYQKNYLSQNIVIGLILKTVHWTMFSLNAIGLEKKFLNEIVQSEKKNFHFNFLIFQFTRERIKLPKRF